MDTHYGNTTNKISRSELWKLFINELQKYSDIKLAIKAQQDSLDRIQKKVNDLNKQNNMLDYLQLAISVINKIMMK
jgi:hypothetical protein